MVFRFTSEVEETVCYGLSKDVEYTLHEVKAPKGYELADDINFKIDENGKVHVINGKKSKKVETVKMTDKKSVDHKKSKDRADGDNDEDDDDDDNPEDTLGARRHKKDEDNDDNENSESRTVETGDNSRMALMLVIFIMSGSANVCLLRSKRKERKKQK